MNVERIGRTETKAIPVYRLTSSHGFLDYITRPKDEGGTEILVQIIDSKKPGEMKKMLDYLTDKEETTTVSFASPSPGLRKALTEYEEHKESTGRGQVVVLTTEWLQ